MTRALPHRALRWELVRRDEREIEIVAHCPSLIGARRPIELSASRAQSHLYREVKLAVLRTVAGSFELTAIEGVRLRRARKPPRWMLFVCASGAWLEVLPPTEGPRYEVEPIASALAEWLDLDLEVVRDPCNRCKGANVWICGCMKRRGVAVHDCVFCQGKGTRGVCPDCVGGTA